MMARVMSESYLSPSSLYVPLQTILSVQGSRSYFPIGTHPQISSGNSAFLRFGSLSLNPHAEEFVPSSLKVENTTVEDFSSSINSTAINLEPCMERRISSDEYRQYVCSQLPDDILPDFNCPAEASAESEQPHASDAVGYRSNTCDINQPCNFKSEHGYVENAELTPYQLSMKFNASMVGTANSASYVFRPQQSASINQLSFSQKSMRPASANDLKVGFYKDFTNRPVLNDPGSSQSLNILPSKFPNITVENFADKFSSNGNDLDLILNTLTRAELQEGTTSCQSQLSAAAAPYMSATNIPSPSSFKSVSRQSQHHEDASNQPFHMDSHANFSSSYLQHNRRSSMGMFSGPLKPPHSSGEASFILDLKVPGQEGVDRNIGREIWFEMGDAVASTFMEKQDKGPNHARMSNAYYEHARQAHLAGKLALAKDSNAKGQWHMEQVKRENIKGGDIFGRQNSCFANMGHTTHHSLLRPENVFIR